MPLMKAPKRPTKDFPPLGYGKAHTIKSKDENWWTLAKDYGFSDPWHIIIYNFNTTDPREVNWYLKNLVGATRTTPDKQNYCFNVGNKIYIPPTAWKPDYDKLLLHGIVNTLTKSAVLRVNVRINRFNIRGRHYLNAANRMVDGAIRIRYDAKVGKKLSEYDSARNALALPWYRVNTVTRQALVVHEATHIVLDMMKAKGLWIVESEAAAYMAQCLYARIQWGGKRRLTDGNGDLDYLFQVATDAADVILGGGSPDVMMIEELLHAVKDYEPYRATWNKTAQFDGVPNR